MELILTGLKLYLGYVLGVMAFAIAVFAIVIFIFIANVVTKHMLRNRK